MAKKRYRSLVERTGDPRGEIRVGVDPEAGFLGAGPGEEFEFDYDRPGYDEQALINAGVIEVVGESKTKKEE